MINRKWIALLLMTFAFAIGSGCAYRASISQGNLIKEEDLAQLEVGMTKLQVRYLLGTPMIDDPFNKERWDYIYYLKLGRNDASFKRWVSVIFEEDVVSEIRKDQELDPGL
ncbi:MAG: outer membrane protein assembly factor BamE [Gammaproteobacteria bacterium]|nr:outer membrane protein assembly factor BamE [Gammaproteobacteria bacterium]